MSKQNVSLKFEQAFKGTLNAENGSLNFGVASGEFKPYDLLLGALGSCLYATFLEIVNKKRLTYDEVLIDIEGIKRTEIPTTLETVSLIVTVKGANKEKGFDQALKLATEYCSVYQTISKVADMSYRLVVETKQ